MDQLEKYREELMACNEKILEGLLRRNAVVEGLMAYKEKNNMPIAPAGAGRTAAYLAGEKAGRIQT